MTLKQKERLWVMTGKLRNMTTIYLLVSKKFALLKKPMTPSRFRTHPAVPELSALCVIPVVFLKA